MDVGRRKSSSIAWCDHDNRNRIHVVILYLLRICLEWPVDTGAGRRQWQTSEDWRRRWFRHEFSSFAWRKVRSESMSNIYLFIDLAIVKLILCICYSRINLSYLMFSQCPRRYLPFKFCSCVSFYSKLSCSELFWDVLFACVAEIITKLFSTSKIMWVLCEELIKFQAWSVAMQ